ncbi:uncharacterized protein LOC115629834 [Scaptodrosophila lebanonensis]|uniref:Mitochondrial cardiolipin hydrolase n=1 Tax=Drosophila lebanonensis TaxID=7225 RepID=A0A6J2U0Q5_DROLE|nr:uncharacterized protein LOC115629834 [Scaptodrosophila lebanonensis]
MFALFERHPLLAAFTIGVCTVLASEIIWSAFHHVRNRKRRADEDVVEDDDKFEENDTNAAAHALNFEFTNMIDNNFVAAAEDKADIENEDENEAQVEGIVEIGEANKFEIENVASFKIEDLFEDEDDDMIEFENAIPFNIEDEFRDKIKLDIIKIEDEFGAKDADKIKIEDVEEDQFTIEDVGADYSDSDDMVAGEADANADDSVDESLSPIGDPNSILPIRSMKYITMLLDLAVYSIDITMCSISSLLLMEALKRAVDRGVIVRIISSHNMINIVKAKAWYPVNVRIPFRGPLLTFKTKHTFCIVDGVKRVEEIMAASGYQLKWKPFRSVFIVGTFNWTRACNCSITYDKVLITPLYDEYERMWKNCKMIRNLYNKSK